jgi:hypothetical protein
MMALWAAAAVLQLVVASSRTQLACHQPMASSIGLSWGSGTALPDTDVDRYAVALAASGSARPFELQLAEATTGMTLIDLLPSTTYHLQLRAHRANETLGWGWSDVGSAVTCSTAASALALLDPCAVGRRQRHPRLWLSSGTNRH